MTKVELHQLLSDLGGESGCRRLAKNFYARVAQSDILRPLFPGKSLRCASEEFAAFLIQFLDGDPAETHYRWWLGLRESHSRFQISEVQRVEWLSLMHETLEDTVSGKESRAAMNQLFGAASGYIVGRPNAEVGNCAPDDRWSLFQSLDDFVGLLAKEQDQEAIAIANRFAQRPDITIGILAKMMATGRELLLNYVREAIGSNSDLAEGQYNGRSLLHHAAGHGCLPIVRLLLEIGVDPNLPDTGGHAPLYRAAGSRCPEITEVIHQLISAGANVNHSGGASRGTALHQAARHGNLPAVIALVNSGAFLKAKDRKGMTPLDRSKSMRRPEVEAYLNSVGNQRE